MKTKNLFTAVVLGLFTVLTIQAQEKSKNNNKHEHMEMNTDKTMYACPMHSDVKSDKAGGRQKYLK